MINNWATFILSFLIGWHVTSYNYPSCRVVPAKDPDVRDRPVAAAIAASADWESTLAVERLYPSSDYQNTFWFYQLSNKNYHSLTIFEHSRQIAKKVAKHDCMS